MGFGVTEMFRCSETSPKVTFRGFSDKFATIADSLFCPSCSRLPTFITASRKARGPYLTGYISSRGFSSSRQMPLTFRSTGFFTSDTYMVSVLSNGYGPSSFEYVTDTLPVLPGRIGSLVQSTSVHPHVDTTLYITTGLSDMLVIVNEQDTGPLSSMMLPKLCTILSTSRTEPIFSCAEIGTTKSANSALTKMFLINFIPKLV